MAVMAVAVGQTAAKAVVRMAARMEGRTAVVRMVARMEGRTAVVGVANRPTSHLFRSGWEVARHRVAAALTSTQCELNLQVRAPEAFCAPARQRSCLRCSARCNRCSRCPSRSSDGQHLAHHRHRHRRPQCCRCHSSTPTGMVAAEVAVAPEETAGETVIGAVDTEHNAARNRHNQIRERIHCIQHHLHHHRTRCRQDSSTCHGMPENTASVAVVLAAAQAAVGAAVALEAAVEAETAAPKVDPVL